MRKTMHEQIAEYLGEQKDATAVFLQQLIQIPSVSGEETEIINFLEEATQTFGEQTKLFLTNALKSDPDYTQQEHDEDLSGHYNLIIRRPSGGEGRSLILQAHTDTVPVSEAYTEAFSGKYENGVIYGRGACDDKGSVAVLYMVLKCLHELDITLQGNLDVQLVIAEESGGNGALACVRDGARADGVIVLEATNLHIHPANRGALWFRVQVEGKSVHMGKITEGVNAIEKGMKIISALREYEQTLIEESKGYAGFEKYQQPVQVNIGSIHGGEYPSTVAGHVTIEGGVGFLPNKNLALIQRELRRTIEAIDDVWIQEHFQLDFPKLHNEAFECSFTHPLVGALKTSCDRLGLSSEICGLDVSCDARLYAIKGNMPTLVFGPGNIADAHSHHEQISIDEILTAARAVLYTIIDWCGVS